jgi:hypothetical protein
MSIFNLKDDSPEPPIEENPRVTKYVESRIAAVKEKFNL